MPGIAGPFAYDEEQSDEGDGPARHNCGKHHEGRSPARAKRDGKRERVWRRFLWGCVKRSKLLPDGGTTVDVAPLVARLRRSSPRRGRSARWGSMTTRTGSGMTSTLNSRGTARSARVAHRARGSTSEAAGLPVCPRRRRGHRAGAASYGGAGALALLFDSAAYIFGDALGDPPADKLLAALKAAGSDGLTRRDIINGVLQKNLSAVELGRIVRVLQDAHLATSRREDSRGGRPAERWFYTAPSYGQNGQSAVAGSSERTLSVLTVGPGVDTRTLSVKSVGPWPESTPFDDLRQGNAPELVGPDEAFDL